MGTRQVLYVKNIVKANTISYPGMKSAIASPYTISKATVSLTEVMANHLSTS